MKLTRIDIIATNGDAMHHEYDLPPLPPIPVKRNKYKRTIKGVELDVYDVLKAWQVTCPALQHLIKKALQAGNRGHKDLETDLQDIIDSAVRAKELQQDN